MSITHEPSVVEWSGEIEIKMVQIRQMRMSILSLSLKTLVKQNVTLSESTRCCGCKNVIFMCHAAQEQDIGKGQHSQLQEDHIK